MRQKQNVQLSFAVPASNHPRAQLLEKISRIIDENPNFIELVWQDLRSGKNDHGNHGLTAEQLLRLTVFKHLEQFTYDDLMFHLNETPIYQTFCRIGIGGKIPSRSAVADGIKAIQPETWEMVVMFDRGFLRRYGRFQAGIEGLLGRMSCFVRRLWNYGKSIVLLITYLNVK